MPETTDMTGSPAPATADRGPTYTEQHRHQCEVRYVLSLGKAGRDAYFYGDDKRKPLAAVRGEAAAALLIADARAAFEARKAARRATPSPNSPREGQGSGAQGSSPASVIAMAYGYPPGDGSFLTAPVEGWCPTRSGRQWRGRCIRCAHRSPQRRWR